MKLSDLTPNDLELYGVPSLSADGKPLRLSSKHHASYLFQMNSKYGEIDIVLSGDTYVAVSNGKYLVKQAAHYAYIQSEQFAKDKAEGESMVVFLKGLKNTD